jgi:DNA-binding transcriptional ArsR family regulator
VQGVNRKKVPGGADALLATMRGLFDLGMRMSDFSLARTERVLVERLGEEVVVYDQDADVAHCLSPSAAAVWEHADGSRGVAQIAQATGLDEGEVSDALAQLRAAGLIEEPPAAAELGHTRREATKRILRTGALAAAAPLIYTVAIAPAAAMASAGSCAPLGCYGQDADQAVAQEQANAQCSGNADCPVCAGGDGGIQITTPNGQFWVVAGICTN